MDSKDIQVKRLTDQILLRIKGSFETHRRRVQKLNNQKSYPGGYSKGQTMQSFYNSLGTLLDQLKNLQKTLNRCQKLKKERKKLYERKVADFIVNLESIRKNKHLIRIKINEYLMTLIKETSSIINQASIMLRNYQKDSGFCCGGGAKDQKQSVQTAMTELCCKGFLWSSLGKFQSITGDSVKQIYLPVQYNEDQFRHLQNQIKSSWPDPEVQVIQKQVIVREQKPQKKDDSNLREAVQMLYGFTQPQNINRALEIYKSEQKKPNCHPKVYLALGQLYESGKYLPKDLNKALNYFKKCAVQNESEGLYKIGVYLEKGYINSKNHFEGMYPNRQSQIRGGIQYYQKAAKLGHLDAMTDLGYIYEKGIQSQDGIGYFIEPHPNHALNYYLKAKKSQFPRAYNNLGTLYITCPSLSSEIQGGNQIKGIRYLERAVQYKYPKAFLNLGKCYENGIGVSQSIDRARALYLEGAELGNMMCKLEYVKSCFGYKINDSNTLIKMVQLTRQVLSEDSRNPQALYYMGLFFQQGIVVQSNKESSFYYIQTSARLDYGPAITKLGDYYYSGHFVAKDVTYAKVLYQKAAQMNEPKAITNLGVLAERGVGLAQNDPKLAQTFYQKAAQLGNTNALIFLSQANKNIKEKNETLTQAAQMGNIAALRIAKSSKIMIPKKKRDPNEYTQTLKNMQSHYLKSNLRSFGPR